MQQNCDQAGIIVLLSNWKEVTFSCVMFQLESWLEELRQEPCDEAADTLEAAERQLEQCSQQRDSSLDACVNTIAQGETLLQELR